MDADDILKNQLDAMLAGAEKPEESAATAETLPAPVPEAPVEVDPLAHLIGCADPNADRDPFSLELDAILAAEGADKNTETPERKTQGYEEHEWEFKETLIYEEDQVQAICKKCFRQMRMDRKQTWNEAMAAHQINNDCGMGITSDVMDS